MTTRGDPIEATMRLSTQDLRIQHTFTLST